MSFKPFSNSAVEQIFLSYSPAIKKKLLELRELIYQTAEQHGEVGEIEETLKWQSPSYLTHNPKSGTTIRLDRLKLDDAKYALSVHCQTSLVAEFKQIYPELNYDGNRSLIMDINSELPLKAAKDFIYMALTYHVRKK